MYINIYYEKNIIQTDSSYPIYEEFIHEWSDEGYIKTPFKRYAYKIDEKGTFKTITGEHVKKVHRWNKDDVEKGLIFESDIKPEMRYLVDKYPDSEVPSDNHRLMMFDIETDSSNGFSKGMDAEGAITAIAYYTDFNKKYKVLLVDNTDEISNTKLDVDGRDCDVEIFTTESDLLNAFLQDYTNINPTIISGYNSDDFDVPYIYNRLKKVLGKEYAKRLSPIGIVNYNKIQKRFVIAGVSHLDYMKLYKTFTFGQRPSYSLDNIAMFEIKKGKIKYDGSLDKLYRENKQKFIEYNLNDVILMVEMDEKLKFIDLAKGIAHKGRVGLEDIYFSSRYLDGAILVYIKNLSMVTTNKPVNELYDNDGEKIVEEINDDDDEGTFTGAFVKEPIPGFYKWLIDLDFASMYPAILRTLNISPETKLFKIKNFKDIDEKFGVKL